MKFKTEVRKLVSRKGNSFVLQDATLGDVEKLNELENLCFSYDQITKPKFKAFIQKNTSHLLVLKDKDVLVGYVLTLFRKNSKKCRIYSLCVHPNYSGQGLAGLIMQGKVDLLKSLKELKVARLEVKTSNATAIKIYEQIGFKYERTIEEFYSDGESALIYNIELK